MPVPIWHYPSSPVVIQGRGHLGRTRMSRLTPFRHQAPFDVLVLTHLDLDHLFAFLFSLWSTLRRGVSGYMTLLKMVRHRRVEVCLQIAYRISRRSRSASSERGDVKICLFLLISHWPKLHPTRSLLFCLLSTRRRFMSFPVPLRSALGPGVTPRLSGLAAFG